MNSLLSISFDLWKLSAFKKGCVFLGTGEVVVVLKPIFMSILFCEWVGNACHVSIYSVDKTGEATGLSQRWVNHIEIQWVLSSSLIPVGLKLNSHTSYSVSNPLASSHPNGVLFSNYLCLLKFLFIFCFEVVTVKLSSMCVPRSLAWMEGLVLWPATCLMVSFVVVPR